MHIQLKGYDKTVKAKFIVEPNYENKGKSLGCNKHCHAYKSCTDSSKFKRPFIKEKQNF